MFDDLDADQQALAQLMSDLSEEAYAAGWVDGLEFALWEAVLGQRHAYGQTEIGDDKIECLRALSSRCGGWIVFDDDQEQTFVPMADWLQFYERDR